MTLKSVTKMPDSGKAEIVVHTVGTECTAGALMNLNSDICSKI